MEENNRKIEEAQKKLVSNEVLPGKVNIFVLWLYSLGEVISDSLLENLMTKKFIEHNLYVYPYSDVLDKISLSHMPKQLPLYTSETLSI